MKKFFYPESIVVFGVSPTDNNLARIIVDNLDRFQFSGKVFPVEQKKENLAGEECLHRFMKSMKHWI